MRLITIWEGDGLKLRVGGEAKGDRFQDLDSSFLHHLSFDHIDKGFPMFCTATRQSPDSKVTSLL